MPHGIKKSSSKNNKKKKANQRTTGITTSNVGGVTSGTGGSIASPFNTQTNTSNTTGTGTTNTSNSNGARQVPNQNDFPDCSSPTSFTSSSSSSSSSSPAPKSAPKSDLSTIYQRYKQATERFKDSLLQLVPSIPSTTGNSKGNTLGVQTLMDAVDYLHNQSQQQPPSEENLMMKNPDILLQIMEDLKTAISFRQRVTRLYYQKSNSTHDNTGSNSNSYDGDEGHNYFVQVLNYCWVTLKPIVRQYCYINTPDVSSSSLRNQSKDDDLDPIRNRFAALSIDDVFDDTDTTDSTTPVRPTIPTNLKEYTIHDLTHGDDYFYAWMFLDSLEEMMQSVSVSYGRLKKAWRTHTDRGIPSDAFVKVIMEASMYVNSSLQQIMMMEEELEAKYPYLNTVYRMMMFLVNPSLVKDFTDSVIGSVSNPHEFLASCDAVAFMGDIVECEFRDQPSDPFFYTDAIVAKFCSKWKLDARIVKKDVLIWKLIGQLEAPLHLDSNKMHVHEMLGIESHAWLSIFKYIGGDRCMMNTIRMLQFFSDVMKDTQSYRFKHGYFGQQWDEGQKKATKIRGDMNELLLGDLLPPLFSMCSGGYLSTELPRESELLTFFTVLKSHTQSPEKAVPWSLAFAVHALLTSFFEMQGDNDIEELGLVAESSWDTYLSQIHLLFERNDDDVQANYLPSNLYNVQFLRGLVSPLYDHGALIEKRAVWNPLCAGLFMQYICFFSNLDGGIAVIDSLGQLRMILHLFNACVQVGAIKIGDIPFLDWLHNTFKDCKGVWEGPLPKKGEFVKRYWISFGVSIQDAQQLATVTHTRLRGTTNVNTTSIPPPHLWTYLEVTPIKPEDISKCFRRVCLNDFTGMESCCHSSSQRQRNVGSHMYDLGVGSNTAMDAMESEDRILASNFIVIGSMLNEFIVELPVVLKWTSKMNQMIAGTIYQPNFVNLRHLLFLVMAEELFGPLDVIPDLDALVHFDEYRSLTHAANYLRCYFEKIRLSDVQLFTPTRQG